MVSNSVFLKTNREFIRQLPPNIRIVDIIQFEFRNYYGRVMFENIKYFEAVANNELKIIRYVTSHYFSKLLTNNQSNSSIYYSKLLC